jgi:cytochrome c-type biogenesis protein CcmH
MTIFLSVTAILILLVIAVMFPALLGLRNPARTATPSSNLGILREQMADLEKEHADGLLGAADFQEAREELRQRLLEENTADSHPDRPAAASRAFPFSIAILALLLTVGGFAGYLQWGNLAALDPRLAILTEQAQADAMPMTQAQIDAMVADLESRLQENPDDVAGWQMLARTYRTLDRPAEAAAAYAKIEARQANDPDFLTDYAETLAYAAMPKPDGASNGQAGTRDADRLAFQGKPRELLRAALRQDPNHAKALFLAGVAAMEAGDEAETRRHWEKLLPHVEEGSELHSLLASNLTRLKERNKSLPRGK